MAKTGYYRPSQTVSGGSTTPDNLDYFNRYGLNYDPNYQPITGYQNFSYTDAVNQGYSPEMAEAAARGQGIPQYQEAQAPNIEDQANLLRRESQGGGMGLFAAGMAGILGAAGLIGAYGGGAAAGSAGSAAGGGGSAGAAEGGLLGSSAAGGGAGAAAGAAPAGIEGVTVLGSSGAGLTAGEAAALGGAGLSAAELAAQGASDTSATNARNDAELQNMDQPTLGTDWQAWANRARGLLGSATGGQDAPAPGFGGGGGGGLLGGGGGGSRAGGVANQVSRVMRSPLENYMAVSGLLGKGKR